MDLLPALDRFLEVANRAKKQRAIAKAEAKIQNIMRKYFKKQYILFAREHARFKDKYPLEEAIGSTELAHIMEILRSGTAEDLRDAVEQVMGETMDEASDSLMADVGMGNAVGIAFNLKNPLAVQWLQNYGAALVTGLEETTKGQMATLLARATEQGWAYNRTARTIRETFDGFSTRRATTVAVTESRKAYEHARLQTALGLQEAGLEMEKSWLAAGDACETCLDNAEDEWIPVDDSFSSGDDAPPAHPDCRCDLLTQRKGATELGFHVRAEQGE